MSAVRRQTTRQPRRHAAAMLALLGALSGYGVAAQALETLRDHVDSGGTVDLNGYASNYGAANHCASDPAQVEILVPPQNGTTHVTLERQIASNSADGSTAPRECDGAIKNVSMLYYTARPDFVGEDRVTVRVNFVGGQQHDYLFIVKVGGGSPKAAAASATQPVATPDDNATATPAPTSKNMGDFLSGVAGSGTPAPVAGTQATARARTTSTNAGDFLSQAAAQGVPSSATPRARSTATPMAIKQPAPGELSTSPQQLAPSASDGPSMK